MKFEGIYTPAITPLAADGSIDKAAFAEVLEYLVESKIHGVIIGGSTGEYYAHTTQERIELAAQAKDVLHGRLPLIVGTGGIRTEDAVAFAQHAKEIKADALLVGTPPYALPTQQEIALHVKAVDAAADLPIMLYNYPGRMSVSMGEEFFDAGAKYHVPANTPYTRYFLANILQFQFYKALCDASGFKGPLYECSFYGSKAAGEKYSAMLSKGASQPWQKTMKELTGGEKMDASAVLEYFAPLQGWLKQQNAGSACGWNPSAACARSRTRAWRAAGAVSAV